MTCSRRCPIRLVLCASLLCVAGLAAAPSAMATRYATPTPGATPNCSQANPCDIETAINGAPAAETEVILSPGHYGETTPIATILMVNNTNMVVHPAPGDPRPIVSSQATNAFNLSAGSRLEDVDVRASGTNNGVLVNGGGLVDRVIVSTATAVNACLALGAGTFRNSVCWNTRQTANPAAAAVSSTGDSSGTFRNVTAIATGPGSYGLHVQASTTTNTVTLTASNVIARGGPVANGGSDVKAATSGVNATATATLNNSNYVTESEVGTGNESITDPGTPTNQVGDPLFADEANGDFHQHFDSPTINAGVNGAANGTLDFERDARQFGANTDIGADEFLPRFASPMGTGDACSQANPCSLVEAVNNSPNNREVIVTSGIYGDPTTALALEDNGNTLYVHGEAGQPPPVVFSNSGTAISLSGAGTRLSYLDLRHSGISSALATSGAFAGLIDQLVVSSTGTNSSSSACLVTGGLVRNTVCRSAEGNGLQALGDSDTTVTLRNVTALSSSATQHGVRALARSSGADLVVDAKNVIARAGGSDVAAHPVFNDASATINIDHSNFADSEATGPVGGPDGVINSTAPQSAAPVFVDEVNGDLRQRSCSPTVNAGVNDAVLNGPFDFEGHARLLDGTTDIGADEFAPGGPDCSSGGSSGGSSSTGGASGAGTGVGTGISSPLAPSNVFSFGKFDPLTGVFVVNAPGPGDLVGEDAKTAKKSRAAAKTKRKPRALLKRVRATASKAGPVRLKLKLTKLGRARLRLRGKLAAIVRITYTPRGGKARSVDKRITFKVRRKKTR